MPKIVDYEKRKSYIAQEAVHVFIEKGFHKTKLLDIAKKCGMGRTTLYQYFKNKDDIFKYVVDNERNAIIHKFDKIKEDNTINSIDKIKKIIQEVVSNDFISDIIIIFVELWLLVKRENKFENNILLENAMKIRSMFKDLLNMAMNDGEIKEIDPQMMSYTIFSFVEAMAIERYIDKDVTLEQKIEAVNVLIDGLKK
ncbi:TetR/AcrR family transcriptional regulator [Abyssisolibacter fermentans]|uniref:TetR/AcrR family transcriptional regulator n=1 Tax=Abyssisolibacter fermentans TaxID=1766203 RepID=UPI0008378C58|nr:TetR/AcrR family transcriptional regulator [Abyssisolibacter fermentans]